MAVVKYLLLLAVAIACVVGAEVERTKKEVLVGAYPYAAYPGLYAGGYVPTTYSSYSGIYPSVYSGLLPYGYRSIVY